MNLGTCHFTDSAAQTVNRSDDDRQHVMDDDVEPAYGVWLHPHEYSQPIAVGPSAS